MLKFEVSGEGSAQYYYLRLKEGKILWTASFESVLCEVAIDKSIVRVVLDEPNEGKGKLAETFRKLMGIASSGELKNVLSVSDKSIVLLVSLKPPASESTCTLNIDLDELGAISGIEII